MQTLYIEEGCQGPDIQCPLWQCHCVPWTRVTWWADRPRQEFIIVEAVSKSFVAQGLVWPLLYTFLYSLFQYFLRQKASGLDQLCGTATMLLTLLDPVVGCASPLHRVKLHKFSSRLWSFLLFFSTNLDLYFLLFALSCSHFDFLLIQLFIVWLLLLFFFMNWLVNI